MKRALAGYGIFILLFLPLPVHAGASLDTVQANVNKVLDVLRDPALKADSAKEIRRKARIIYDRMFDDVELSRRTLARTGTR